MGVPLASVAARCGQVLDDGGPHLVAGLEPGLRSVDQVAGHVIGGQAVSGVDDGGGPVIAGVDLDDLALAALGRRRAVVVVTGPGSDVVTGRWPASGGGRPTSSGSHPR